MDNVWVREGKYGPKITRRAESLSSFGGENGRCWGEDEGGPSQISETSEKLYTKYGNICYMEKVNPTVHRK